MADPDAEDDEEPKRPELRERIARRVARWADLPLAEDASGAQEATPPAPASIVEPELPGQAEAREKFYRWKNIDPFPRIEAALLNSADIDDYMRTAALVFPYDPEKRKTASYALSVGGEIAYWDPKAPDDAPVRQLATGAAVIIPPNSLIYVRTAELFQLPNYMAVRFNLHIDLVHKGLLLGTGPLVDPGFFGRLMVPLHNLTSNTYVLAVGDDFIWAEFTKTSSAAQWSPAAEEEQKQCGELTPFPDRKTDRSLSDYIYKAKRGHAVLQAGLSHQSLQNAIPDAIDRAQKTAKGAKSSATKAERDAGKMKNFVFSLGLLAFLGAAATLATQIGASRTAFQSTLGLVRDTNTDLAKQELRIRQLETELKELRAAVDRAAPADRTQSETERCARRGSPYTQGASGTPDRCV